LFLEVTSKKAKRKAKKKKKGGEIRCEPEPEPMGEECHMEEESVVGRGGCDKDGHSTESGGSDWREEEEEEALSQNLSNDEDASVSPSGSPSSSF